MQTAITFTGTAEEIAALLESINGSGTASAGKPAKASAPAKSSSKPKSRFSASDLSEKTFVELKKLAERLGIDPSGKKSAGLRKAILEAQDEPEDEVEEEEDLDDEEEDGDWEDEEEPEDEEDEDEDEEEEDEEPPAPAKRPAKRSTAAKKAPARRRR